MGSSQPSQISVAADHFSPQSYHPSPSPTQISVSTITSDCEPCSLRLADHPSFCLEMWLSPIRFSSLYDHRVLRSSRSKRSRSLHIHPDLVASAAAERLPCHSIRPHFNGLGESRNEAGELSETPHKHIIHFVLPQDKNTTPYK